MFKSPTITQLAQAIRADVDLSDWSTLVPVQAQINYSPAPYAGPVSLYRVRRLSRFRSGDPRMGWKQLVEGSLEVKLIEGRHNNILEEPDVHSLAQELETALAQTRLERGPPADEPISSQPN